MNIREKAEALIVIEDTPLKLLTTEQRDSHQALLSEGMCVAYAREYLRVLDALLQVSQTWNRHLESDYMYAALTEIDRICEQALEVKNAVAQEANEDVE